jgi:recombination protein RecR
MNSLPEPVQTLIAALRQLPGLGPRSAERAALFLVQCEPRVARQLADAVVLARERIGMCQVCGGLTESQPCPLCQAPQRDSTLLCVVERAVDILSVEKTGAFKGRYHVLGGKISPLNGVGPEDLRIADLDRRLDAEPIRELILALGADVEGDATSYFLAQRFAGRAVRVSRLAHGLPAGGGLDYADELTLSQAIEGRRPLGPDA